MSAKDPAEIALYDELERDSRRSRECHMRDAQTSDKGTSKDNALGPSAVRKPDELPRPPLAPEPPKAHMSPEPLGCHVSPVSNEQGVAEVVTARAAVNACKKRGAASKALFQLARDMRAVERRIGREAAIIELMPFFDEWYRISQAFLDPAKTRDDYFAEFIAGLRKVRVPTGEGDTLNKALKSISKLSEGDLPQIPGYAAAPKSWRRVAALHREMSRRTGGNTYFLSCRDAAKAFPGLSYQAASDINRALERLGVLKIVRAGDARPNGKASQFQYLLSQRKNGAEEDDGLEI